jgi:hypothetical protein
LLGCPLLTLDLASMTKTCMGTLTIYAEFDGTNQVYRPESKKYVGWIPTVTGYIRGYYENVVGAIQGTAELAVKPEQSRDGIPYPVTKAIRFF